MLDIVVAFRVAGSDVDPKEISALLSLMPSSSHRHGEPHWGKGGRRYSDFSEGMWSLETTLEKSRPLTEHLDEIGLALAGKEAVLRHLRSRAYDPGFFIGVFNVNDGDEVGLTAAQMRTWADLSIDVCFDLYAWNEPEVESIESSR